jgi:hypothetical protein
MGQVPVKITGNAAVGDYIVASPDGSGFGYAVNPAKITTAEMSRIAGVAWSASGDGDFSMINTAVGVNTQATNHVIKKQEDEISMLKTTVNQLSEYLQSKDSTFKFAKLDTKPAAATIAVKPLVSDNRSASGNAISFTVGFSKLSPEEQLKRVNKVAAEKLKKVISEKPEYIDAVIKIMKEKIEGSGQDLNGKAELKRLLTDRAFLIEKIKEIYSIQ